ncbi:hypothetical protein [Streptomyces sp. DH12]|uniref:hypothetical protein n=1 Tax=Streptomyces sp. DH12 TaxID=2857010 RepID=UPI001E5236EB|nr:hypothetical protein [Streptomyces sp. DH12]
MALHPLAVHELTETVLGCVCAALEVTAAEVEGQPGCPCRVCVVPGQPAWDSCDDPCTGETGGQLTVHVARIYPSTTFPTEDREVRGVRSCTPPPVTAVELVVTLLRCAPLPTEDGCPPSCDELGAAARTLHLDATTIYNALLCCLPGTSTRRRGRRFVLGAQRTLGPEGGCVGIEQRATVALPGCARCPGDEPEPRP